MGLFGLFKGKKWPNPFIKPTVTPASTTATPASTTAEISKEQKDQQQNKKLPNMNQELDNTIKRLEDIERQIDGRLNKLGYDITNLNLYKEDILNEILPITKELENIAAVQKEIQNQLQKGQLPNAQEIHVKNAQLLQQIDKLMTKNVILYSKLQTAIIKQTESINTSKQLDKKAEKTENEENNILKQEDNDKKLEISKKIEMKKTARKYNQVKIKKAANEETRLTIEQDKVVKKQRVNINLKKGLQKKREKIEEDEKKILKKQNGLTIQMINALKSQSIRSGAGSVIQAIINDLAKTIPELKDANKRIGVNQENLSIIEAQIKKINKKNQDLEKTKEYLVKKTMAISKKQLIK